MSAFGFDDLPDEDLAAPAARAGPARAGDVARGHRSSSHSTAHDAIGNSLAMANKHRLQPPTCSLAARN